MGLDHLLLLAAIQGITEFLPISSSGHLQLIHGLSAYPDHGLIIDIALHAGTLVAVMAYFHRDVVTLFTGTIDIARGHRSSAAHLVQVLVIASLPVFLAGAALVASDWASALRTPETVAWASIIFAIPLWLSDRVQRHAQASDPVYNDHHSATAVLSPRQALIIGLTQILALIPGASRAGVTITAGLFLGFDRTQAARFSMLLAMPVIAAFALVGLIDLIRAGDDQALGTALGAAALAAVFAFATIHIFLRVTRRIGLLPFVIYRIGLGVCLLYIIA